ncbi:MAG: tetratricopeptide repeat protein [Ignavibacteriales bacterium]|nr:tetratricopeptide repeat protein [Ignavibacteriales bacterium]
MRLLVVITIALLGLTSCGITTYVPARMAAKFYDEGDYANAIHYYMKAVADRDQRAETFFWLGMSFYKLGDLEEAMLALERSFEKDSTDVAVIERLAAANLDLGNLPKAGYYCRKAIHIDADYLESYNTLGHVLFEGGELDSAESCFSYALSLSKSSRWKSIADASFRYYEGPRAEASNGLGEICIARGLFYESLVFFDAANSLANHWETPWFNKGRAYEALGNTKAAEVAYQRTIDLAPGKAGAFRNLGRMYRRLRRDSEAMSLYRRAIRIDSTDVESYYALAELYDKNDDKWNAADTYNRAVDRAPDDPSSYSRAARANMLIGNYDLAIEFLSEVVELQPQHADGHNALGEAYRAAGDTVQARQAFEEAIAIDSLYSLPLRNLGELLLQENNASEGLKYYVRAARLGDEKAAAFLRSRGLD